MRGAEGFERSATSRQAFGTKAAALPLPFSSNNTSHHPRFFPASLPPPSLPHHVRHHPQARQGLAARPPRRLHRRQRRPGRLQGLRQDLQRREHQPVDEDRRRRRLGAARGAQRREGQEQDPQPVDLLAALKGDALRGHFTGGSGSAPGTGIPGCGVHVVLLTSMY
ncbi:hypothetical protein DFJ74DRAFT_659979 [Hyaloraphidium curvatum]|nr:hypothetical protein DFJ74DRAFT_659979 [Hyaloraphidium curvatum]